MNNNHSSIQGSKPRKFLKKNRHQPSYTFDTSDSDSDTYNEESSLTSRIIQSSLMRLNTNKRTSQVKNSRNQYNINKLSDFGSNSAHDETIIGIGRQLCKKRHVYGDLSNSDLNTSSSFYDSDDVFSDDNLDIQDSQSVCQRNESIQIWKNENFENLVKRIKDVTIETNFPSKLQDDSSEWKSDENLYQNNNRESEYIESKAIQDPTSSNSSLLHKQFYRVIVEDFQFYPSSITINQFETVSFFCRGNASSHKITGKHGDDTVFGPILLDGICNSRYNYCFQSLGDFLICNEIFSFMTCIVSVVCSTQGDMSTHSESFQTVNDCQIPEKLAKYCYKFEENLADDNLIISDEEQYSSISQIQKNVEPKLLWLDMLEDSVTNSEVELVVLPTSHLIPKNDTSFSSSSPSFSVLPSSLRGSFPPLVSTSRLEPFKDSHIEGISSNLPEMKQIDSPLNPHNEETSSNCFNKNIESQPVPLFGSFSQFASTTSTTTSTVTTTTVMTSTNLQVQPIFETSNRPAIQEVLETFDADSSAGADAILTKKQKLNKKKRLKLKQLKHSQNLDLCISEELPNTNLDKQSHHVLINSETSSLNGNFTIDVNMANCEKYDDIMTSANNDFNIMTLQQEEVTSNVIIFEDDESHSSKLFNSFVDESSWVNSNSNSESQDSYVFSIQNSMPILTDSVLMKEEMTELNLVTTVDLANTVVSIGDKNQYDESQNPASEIDKSVCDIEDHHVNKVNVVSDLLLTPIAKTKTVSIPVISSLSKTSDRIKTNALLAIIRKNVTCEEVLPTPVKLDNVNESEISLLPNVVEDINSATPVHEQPIIDISTPNSFNKNDHLDQFSNSNSLRDIMAFHESFLNQRWEKLEYLLNNNLPDKRISDRREIPIVYVKNYDSSDSLKNSLDSEESLCNDRENLNTVNSSAEPSIKTLSEKSKASLSRNANIKSKTFERKRRKQKQ